MRTAQPQKFEQSACSMTFMIVFILSKKIESSTQSVAVTVNCIE